MHLIIKKSFLLISIFYLSFAALAEVKSDQTPERLIERAVTQLSDAKEKELQSRELIVDANKIRKQLKEIRSATQKKTNFVEVNKSESEISTLVKKLEGNQQQGAVLRAQSKQLKQSASKNFEEGFSLLWRDWVSNRAPLTMDDGVVSYFAHNAKIRSVHKNMLNKMGTPSDEVGTKREDMSLKIPALIQQNAPPDLNINSFKFSRKEKYFAHIEVHSNDKGESEYQSKNVSAVPLNKIHQWRLVVSDLSGKPATNVPFEIEGHMPGHVHGLPTDPRVTKEISPGVYLVEGVKFQMKGWWVIKFIFPKTEDDVAQPDFFTFNLVL
ncbi:FixH family protein [Aliikangiella coralliicola]|nr:FixH family protein [Aliikangiella coralliicola]